MDSAADRGESWRCGGPSKGGGGGGSCGGDYGYSVLISRIRVRVRGGPGRGAHGLLSGDSRAQGRRRRTLYLAGGDAGRHPAAAPPVGTGAWREGGVDRDRSGALALGDGGDASRRPGARARLREPRGPRPGRWARRAGPDPPTGAPRVANAADRT